MLHPALRLLFAASLGAGLVLPGSAQEQGPSSPTSALPVGQWMLLDRVEIVANTDCITLRALDRKVNRDTRMTGTDTREAYMALRTKIALENVNELLKRQAGEDLGFDKELVKARVNDIWDDRVDQQGGVTRATKQLTENSQSVLEKREEIESTIYTSSWTMSVLGRESGPGGRPMFDRYARPGQLRQRYERMKLTGLDVTQALGPAGATAAQYQLQILLVTPRQLGGVEQARDKALEIRAALDADAVDWEDALATFGAFQDSIQQVDQETLVRVLDPGNGVLAAFAEEAEEEAYSPVLTFARPDSTGQRRPEGFAIYKLLGRTPAFVPDFEQEGVQQVLRDFLQLQGDSQRYETGLEELRAKAYVWYPGIERERAEAEAALEDREKQIQEAREQNEAKQAAEEGKKPANSADSGADSLPEGGSAPADAPAPGADGR
jgi:hypothetical protein